jgi:hypothetical protein
MHILQARLYFLCDSNWFLNGIFRGGQLTKVLPADFYRALTVSARPASSTVSAITPVPELCALTIRVVPGKCRWRTEKLRHIPREQEPYWIRCCSPRCEFPRELRFACIAVLFFITGLGSSNRNA